jgi:hypothetical protein
MYEEPVLPTPGDLSDGVVSLELREIAAAVPEKGWAPACDPDNDASRRTCELAGAEYVATVAVPSWHEMYARGKRLKCRYRLLPPGRAA